MYIPGMHEFYEAMNQELLHHMEQAQAAQHDQHVIDAQHGPLDDLHGPFDTHHGHIDDSHVGGLGDLRPDADYPDTTHQGVPHHEDAPGFLERLTPSILSGAASAAIKFVAEAATDAFLSQAFLGDAHPSGGAHSTHDAEHPAPTTHSLSIGHNDGDGFIHQNDNHTCAIVSQEMILHQFHLHDPQTGEPISENKLVDDANANGWLSEHGTSVSNLGKILDHYGVANHVGHDWPHLINDLAAGHQVVMAVNGDRLWNDHSPWTDFANLFGNHPNHAIVVRGMHVDEHGAINVVINDPGSADGAGLEYPLIHFQSAIDSSGFHYVATDHAPADWSPSPEIVALRTDVVNHEPVMESRSFAESLESLNEAERNTFLRDL
ncbi:MAG: hypothetical protein QM811_17475 [Pirellulales bacterium]